MPKVKKKKGFFYIFCITILAIIAFFLFWILKDVPFGLDNQPEQSVPVEVAEKRIDKGYGSGNHRAPSSTHYRYLISFRFSDGSVKELEVDFIGLWGRPETIPYSPVYDEINEGDTGILIYKELENNEQKYSKGFQYQGRKFIRFEKDAEYGGTKVEMFKRPTFKWKDLLIICFVFGPWIIAYPFMRRDDKKYEFYITHSNKQIKRMNKEKTRQEIIEKKKRRKEEKLEKPAKEQNEKEKKET